MGKVFKLQNGLLFLSTEAPGGIYNSTQLKKIASLCDGETAVVKATEDQRLALFVQEPQVAKVAAELKAVGLGVRHYQDGLHQPVNCLGELCSEHLQDAMGTSMDLTRELQAMKLDSPLKIGINGCARVCVATHTLDISIIGDTNGYRISLGGKNSQIPEMASFMAEGVPAAKLPKLIAKVISVYKELAQTDETLQEVMERAGSKAFVEALAPYSQDAHQDEPFAGVPASEELGMATPEVGDDLGDGLAVDDGPNFDDVGPEATVSDELLMDDDDLTAMKASDDDELQLEGDVPIGDELGELSMDDDVSMTPDQPVISDAIDALEMNDTPVTTGDEANLEERLEVEDELVLEDDLEVEDDLMLAGESIVEDDLKLDDELILDDEASVADELMLEDDLSAAVAADELLLDEPSDDAELIDEELLAGAPAATVAAPVVAAPLTIVKNVETAGEDSFENDMIADEVAEDEADAFEAKLNESIAEEESMPEIEDFNSADRLEAMNLVESGNELPSVDAVSETLDTDGSFDNLDIDYDDDQDHELALDSLDASGHDDDKLQAEVSASPSAASAAAPSSGSGGFEFQGFDVDAEGRVSLAFASGANVAIDPRTMMPGSKRDLVIGGKRISLNVGPKGLSVEVDGVSLFLPRHAA